MGNKSNEKVITKIEFSKQDLIINKQLYDQDSDNCLICLEIVVNPIQCQTCKSIYCKQCVLKWRETNMKCPKKCSQQWKMLQIKPKNIQLKCPYDKKCKKISTPETLENHLEDCFYAPNSIKKLIKLKKQYLCRNSHPLTFLSKQKSPYLKFFEFNCTECSEVKICRSACIKCKQYYCIKCRLPTLHRTVCPLKIHRYEYVINQSINCNICGINPQYLAKGCFKDKACDFSICETCYSKFPILQNEEEILAKISKDEQNHVNIADFQFTIVEDEFLKIQKRMRQIQDELQYSYVD